jgi:chromosome segregation ATPase
VSSPVKDVAFGSGGAEVVDEEVVIPKTLTLQADRDALDDAADERFFTVARKGFDKVIGCYHRRKEELSRHSKCVEDLEKTL